MDIIPGTSGGTAAPFGTNPGSNPRNIPGNSLGIGSIASGTSTPSDGGNALRSTLRRQDSTGSGGSGGNTGVWSGAGGAATGGGSESKDDGGEVRRLERPKGGGSWYPCSYLGVVGSLCARVNYGAIGVIGREK